MIDTPGQGGAICNYGTLWLINSTLCSNTAYVKGLGYDLGGSGGGIYNYTGGNLTLTNCTIDGNNTDGGNGGGLYNAGINQNATIQNTIIADRKRGAEFWLELPRHQ